MNKMLCNPLLNLMAMDDPYHLEIHQRQTDSSLFGCTLRCLHLGTRPG
jgi:hypothetical protein